MPGWPDPTWLDRIGELGVRSLVKLVLAVIGLLLLLLFVSILPGVDRLVPGLPITVASIVNASVSLVVVLLLLKVATEARAVIQRFRISAPEIASQSGAIVYWTIVFLAVVFAYEGFGGAVEPVVTDAGILWAYDLAFSLIGGVTLIVIGYHQFRLLDPLAEFIVTRVRSEAAINQSTIQTTLPTKPASDENDSEEELYSVKSER